MTPGERLRQARDTMRYSRTIFGGDLGYKDHKIRDLETGKQKLSPELALEIESRYQISAEWLISGKGEMFSEKYEELPVKKLVTPVKNNWRMQAVQRRRLQALGEHAEKLSEGGTDYDPVVKLVADYFQIKSEGKTKAELMSIADQLMDLLKKTIP